MAVKTVSTGERWEPSLTLELWKPWLPHLQRDDITAHSAALLRAPNKKLSDAHRGRAWHIEGPQ